VLPNILAFLIFLYKYHISMYNHIFLILKLAADSKGFSVHSFVLTWWGVLSLFAVAFGFRQQREGMASCWADFAVMESHLSVQIALT